MGAAAAIILELKGPRGYRPVPVMLPAGATLSIGSDHPSQVLIEDAGIRSQHALLRHEAHGCWIESVGDAAIKLNGRALDGPARLADGDWLLLGSSPYLVTFAGARADLPAAAHATSSRNVERWLTVGRLPECDIRVCSPAISRRHARLQVTSAGTAVLEDLGSTNGTFVAGRRVDTRTSLASGTSVQFANMAYFFDGTTLRPTQGAGHVRLVARGLGKTVTDSVTRQPRTLLRDVNLAIEPGEFAIVFGASGSGKSTLIDALSGRRPATAGAVLYNGLDLYRHFAAFRAAIGYVPQQDIVHRRITVGRALAYTARLRLPEDTSEREIQQHVSDVLKRVGLSGKVNVPIGTPEPLSGGQFKRLSVAVELMSNPAVLFLDEATSGLDAATDKRMMRLFAGLAADGKTVVCVTHTLENADACDVMVLMHHGLVVYVGPPEGARDHFQVGRLSEIYETLESRDPAQWVEHFAASGFYDDWVRRRMHPALSEDFRIPAVAVGDDRGRKLRNGRRQMAILARRYIDLILADRRSLVLLLAQAPVIGLVIAAVFDVGEGPRRAATEAQVSFMLVISAIWFGCLNAAREIVKELPIWRRERAVNLEPLPYLASKLGPLAAIAGVQVAALSTTVSLFLDLSGHASAQAIVLWLTAVAATAMGLALSAFAPSGDRAAAMVPVALIPQVILSGAIVALNGAVEWVARATMISYWAYDAMKNLMGDDVRNAVGPTGAPQIVLEGGLATDIIALAALFTAFLALAWLGLRRGKPR